MKDNAKVMLVEEAPSVGNMASTAQHSTRKLAVIGGTVAVLALVAGILIGYFGRSVQTSASTGVPDGVLLNGVSPKLIQDADPEISAALIEEIKAENIRDYLRNLTARPHLAGTPDDERTANQIKDDWLRWGFDRVDVIPYNVLLSYPEQEKPNLITLRAANGSILHQSQLLEKIVRPDQNQSDVVPPFNAYSAPGNVTSSRMIYVNYGLEEDFHWLKVNKSLNFSGAVGIARYGKNFRANKVLTAYNYGASAMILYSDPLDYTDPLQKATYPESDSLPGTGVQRGTAKLLDGDPLTPFYPSLDSAFREDPDTVDSLPRIPVHPIGYDDARKFLMHLGGEEAPTSWQGSLNLTYRIGGTFLSTGTTVNIFVSTRNVLRNTYNTIGFIEGAVEPDRYILVGNHHDAWVFGALDPSSGTAAMMEVARALTSVMKRKNWRPRRTVVFCAWGAEEFGIIGSVEWVEQFSKVLGQRAVAYLNIDILLEGLDTVRFKATPLLHSMIFKATQKIQNPNQKELEAGRKTVYDTWLQVLPDKIRPDRPSVSLVGSGSDYIWFLQVVGVSCLDVRYTWNQRKLRLSSYPLYHSVYETFHLVDEIMDPGFKYSRSVSQVFGEIIRDLSDSLILPLNITNFCVFLTENSEKILQDHGDLMKANNMTTDIDYFKNALATFTEAATEMQKRVSSVNIKSPYAVRLINDQLMSVQRAFIDPQGLPGRTYFKNILSAPSQFDNYAGAVFPGLTDALFRIDEAEDQPSRWRAVKHHFSVITYTIRSATSTLRNAIEFGND